MEFLFLGLRDDQEKKIREEAPQSALGNLPRITTVQTLAYDEYLEARKAGKVWKQQRRGRWVYWAVQRLRSVHLPGGPTGMYEVTERYKAEVPEGG